MGIAFCEVDAVDIDRYFSRVICESMKPDLVILESKLERDKLKLSASLSCPIFALEELGLNGVIDIFTKLGITVVFVNGQRLTDCVVIAAAKNLELNTIYIQHGMYIPFMRRNMLFFIRRMVKTIRYLRYAFDIGLHFRSPRLVMSSILTHVFGFSRSWVTKYSLLPDVAWVYSDYWKKWHIEYYKFPQDLEFRYMSLPDLTRFTSKDFKDNNTVAYCYQTLVEDGRISRSDMLNFYQELSLWASASSLKIVVKAHPRMDMQLADILRSYGFDIVSDYVPLTSYVIGHYSTLLAFWGLNKRKVICIELPGHNIDVTFSGWAHVTKDISQLNLSDVTNDFTLIPFYFGEAANERKPCF